MEEQPVAGTEELGSQLEPVAPTMRRFRVPKVRVLLVIALVLFLLYRLGNLQGQIDDLVTNDAQASLFKEPADLDGFIADISESVVDIVCGNSGGTGFAYYLDGLDDGFKTFVITNHHVVEDCASGDATVSVTYGGKEMIETESELWNYDEENDLALIQISAELTPLRDADTFAKSGWWTMAIGNPSTESGVLYNAASFGHIVGVEDQYYNYTSAVINRGNSGGPLVNAQGELIGINTEVRRSYSEGFWNIAVDGAVLCEKILKCPE